MDEASRPLEGEDIGTTQAMEEKVLVRIRQLMITQSDAGRREVELTNVPVVVAQAERFRQRLSYWEARILQLGGDSRPEP